VITTIGIIGSGNVAWHLSHEFVKHDLVKLSWIYGRNTETLHELEKSVSVPTFTKYPQQSVDLILICASDDSLQELILSLPHSSKIAYTAGSVPLENLYIPQKKNGIFYPLQTFSKQRKIEFSEIPFLIESFDKEFEQELIELANLISFNVQTSTANQRQDIHLAAVIANNFVNHLLFIAQEYLQNKNIDSHILEPLICETFKKALDTGTFQGQSGPARRNDTQTIKKHIEKLEGNVQEIYRLITENILKTYHSTKK